MAMNGTTLETAPSKLSAMIAARLPLTGAKKAIAPSAVPT
jgi:hypothetical protein